MNGPVRQTTLLRPCGWLTEANGVECHRIRGPRADQDLEEQAYYYATAASPEVGHRFLVAAHDTFALLATQPNMGWQAHLRHADLKGLRVFRVTDCERILLLYLPLLDGVEIVRVVHGSQSLQALLRRQGLV